MTRPAPTTKIMLIEDRRGGISGMGATPVRRYRLARLTPDAQPRDGEHRFGYLKRSYD